MRRDIYLFAKDHIGKFNWRTTRYKSQSAHRAPAGRRPLVRLQDQASRTR